MKDEKRELLQESLEMLEKSLSYLIESYEKCKKIGIKDNYNSQELIEFEALTSRFARTVDILTARAIRSLLRFLREEKNTLIDVANYLEKLEIIENADELLLLRDTRNLIAHEYVLENVNELFKEVLNQTPKIFEISKRLKEFISKYI
ncbi:hypothetical protein [Desulfurobacterium crinifex]